MAVNVSSFGTEESMTRTLTLISCLLLIGLAASGCTKKYSHTLVGSIDRMAAMKGNNYDTGLDVLYIVLSEPAGPRELLGEACPAQLAEVDYRSTYVQYRGARISQPRVEVTRYCIQETRVPR